MSALRRASYVWMSGDEADGLPEGITLTPYMPESGRAASKRQGVVHSVIEAALIKDDEDERLVAAWHCGGSSFDAMEIADDTDPLCIGCQLALRLPVLPCVYRTWNAEGELLYIGSTINPPQRVRAHMTATRWWPEVARMSFEEYETEAEARKAESSAIWNEPSLYNRSGTRKTRSGPLDLLEGIEITTTSGETA